MLGSEIEFFSYVRANPMEFARFVRRRRAAIWLAWSGGLALVLFVIGYAISTDESVVSIWPNASPLILALPGCMIFLAIGAMPGLIALDWLDRRQARRIGLPFAELRRVQENWEREYRLARRTLRKA